MRITSYHPSPHRDQERGFTLVELMIAMVVSSFVIAAIYSAYRVQQRQYTNQTQVVEMQQNLRSAMLFMTSELRMAGYDPQGTAGAGFLTATSSRVQFTKDTENGTTPDRDGDGALTGNWENIIFGFRPSDDTDNDGIADSGAASLRASLDNGVTYPVIIADNIHAIEFNYTMSDGTTTNAPADLSDISSVTISILARSRNADQNFNNSFTYTTGGGTNWGSPFNDNYRRRLLIANIKCRNMGL